MNEVAYNQMLKEKNRVAALSVFAAFLMTTFKIIVGVATGSLGILSEALHSGLDLLAAALTWFAVRVSDKPADEDHHFGHGKIENLSAFIETLLLLVTAGWVIYEAINRLLSGSTHIEVGIWSYIVVISSIIIDFTRSRALMRVAKKHNSQALEADALHFATDVWSSAVVLVGLICANFGIYIADSIAAIGVAIIIIAVSYKLGKRALNVLLDKVPSETVAQIRDLLKDDKSFETYHDLKVRASGSDIFVELNIHLQANTSFVTSHEIASKIESKIKTVIPRSFVHVHVEPDKHTED